ncbi:MAG: DNA replication complex subunit Gins51 [Candidatus Heimdallarchaeota archaeon]
MPEETITFELIRKIQRNEQSSPKLTKLPENFYQNVDGYLKQKRKLEEKEGRKTALEVKNIEHLVEDIFNRRERKILNQALISARTSIPPENLTDEEKVFFDSIIKLIKERRANILEPILHAEEKVEVGKLIIFKEDVPEFVGSDMKTYGPFKKGDVARLPEENMKVLIERGVAEEFKVKE